MKDEDSVSTEYTYYWSPDHALSLDEFLKKVSLGVVVVFDPVTHIDALQYRPSMVQNDGTKPVSASHLWLIV
jgi:hypothetical protein